MHPLVRYYWCHTISTYHCQNQQAPDHPTQYTNMKIAHWECKWKIAKNLKNHVKSILFHPLSLSFHCPMPLSGSLSQLGGVWKIRCTQTLSLLVTTKSLFPMFHPLSIGYNLNAGRSLEYYDTIFLNQLKIYSTILYILLKNYHQNCIFW